MSKRECVQFCDGCPFAKGVTEAVTCTVDAQAFDAGLSRQFKAKFSDAEGNETHKLRITDSRTFGDDSLEATVFNKVGNLVAQCQNPVERTGKRLGGLLGVWAIKECAAFSNENPKHPHMNLGDTNSYNSF